MRPLLLPLLLAACQDAQVPDTPTDTDVERPVPLEGFELDVLVLLDGEPTEDVMVMQGGSLDHRRTDADGRARLHVDPGIPGDLAVVAAHPEARIRGVDITARVDEITIELVRFSTDDNPDYVFQDPGTPDRRDNTGYCAHCHIRQSDDWFAHPHSKAASNPVVHDLYAGIATTLNETGCDEAGGTWTTTRQPGGGTFETCVLGDGVLPDLNPDCGAPCDAPVNTADCADCHAPGIDGELGGRDLLEAEGIAFEHGVHCDVCHKVSDIDMDAPPGVGGRLKIIRPSEADDSPSFDWTPLTFGPLPDVLNPRMGSVHTPIFQQAEFCGGCHEHETAPMVPGATLDADRWPSGMLPLQSTFSEWKDGPLADIAPCQSCHMPPDAEAGNAADIDLLATLPGRAGGWLRPPGANRRHAWIGPRSDEADMLGMALTLDLQTEVVEGEVVATTTVRHTGPGHAVPTGEPMRMVLVQVQATCDGQPLIATAGPAVPDFGGALAWQDASGDWDVWPDAQPGDVIRVVADLGWLDYDGFGPFGDGTFSPEDKGLADLRHVGEATVLSVTDGIVSLSEPLPEGDMAFLGRDRGPEASPLAGAPGFAFARVLTDGSGALMVPSHKATDIRTDNRLLPQQSWSGTHSFESACEAPEVTARLLYRAYPWDLAAERGWHNPDRVMAEVTR